MTWYYYQMYGLTLQSQFDVSVFPSIAPLDPSQSPDVVLRYQTLPDELPNPDVIGPFLQVQGHDVLLAYSDWVRYLVRDGREIYADPDVNTNPDMHNVMMRGAVISALLHQRGLWPIHASAIESPQGAVLFVGDSGAGKSTVAASFYRRGYRVLSDDLCAITQIDGRHYVLPAYPALNLWALALQHFGENEAAYQPVRRDADAQEKYYFPVADNFSHQAVPLHAIYWLQFDRGTDDRPITSADQPVRIEPVTGADKMRIIRENIANLRLVHTRERHLALMQLVQSLMPLRLKRLVRPLYGNTFDKVAALLEADVVSGDSVGQGETQ